MSGRLGLFGAVLMLFVAVGCDNRVDVTVKGQAINISKFFTLRFMDNPPKSPAEALTGSTWSGAVAFADVDNTAKSTAAGADGKYEIKFKAAPKTKFRIMIEGGDNMVPEMVQNEYTVPDAAGTIEAGVTPGEQKLGHVDEGAAKALGMPIDDLVKEGLVMFGGITKPMKLPDELTPAGKLTLSVDNGFTAVDCCSTTANTGTSVTADMGFWVITKKGMTAGADVTATLTDPSGKLKFDPVKIHVMPNYSTLVYHSAK